MIMWANPLMILGFLTFLISGLCINILQVILYLLIGWHSPQLFRKINYYFVWMIYGQVMVVADWLAQCKVILHGKPEIFEELGRNHCYVTMNHHYELDFLQAWMVADRIHCLGTAKVFLKKSLGYAPIIGWLWNFSDVIFLDRDWEKDRRIIASSIRTLADYPDPVVLLLFAEGTRFTPEKYEASREFAKKKGLPEFKHHLVPRVKGFIETLRNTDPEKIQYLYDVTVVVNEDKGAPATLSNILQGKSVHSEFYIRRFATKDLTNKDDEAMTDFLMDLYVKKDELKDYYLEHGQFQPEDGVLAVDKPPRYNSLVFSICLNSLVGYYILRGIWGVLASGSLSNILILVVGIGVLLVAFRKMIGLTKISKASTYGKKSA